MPAGGTITTIAGNGIAALSGDDGPATSATLYLPHDVAFDAAGNLFIADTNNGRIRRVDASTGVITTVAGNGVPAFGGDDGPATSTSLFNPSGVALGGSGQLAIADKNNFRVRAVTLVQYTFSGFLPPVENPPVLNVARAGRTIAIKWRLQDADGVQVSSLSAVESSTAGAIACDAAPTSVVGEDAGSTGNSGLRYDPVAGEFIFNWQTMKNWTGCSVLTVTLADGTRHHAKFKFQ